MHSDEFAELMVNGTIETINGPINCLEMDWTPHPVFEGVSMKHLISSEDTGGGLSCHVVRIAPGCTLESHTHTPQWELHEVIGGSGSAILDDRESSYHPGRTAVIPSGQVHSVKAGTDGLTLLAKFFPALL